MNLAFILVDFFAMHVEKRLGCDLDIALFFYEPCQVLFRGKVNVRHMTAKIFLARIGFQFGKIFRFLRPGVADCLGNELGQGPIGRQKPSAV